MDKETKKRLKKLVNSAKKAIELLTDEIEKPVDEDLQDDKARNAFKAKKECFMDAKDLISEIEKIEDVFQGRQKDTAEESSSDFEPGHAERFAKGT